MAHTDVAQLGRQALGEVVVDAALHQQAAGAGAPLAVEAVDHEHGRVEGPVEVGILAWGSTFGECLEAMMAAQAEGIRCAAMKVVMLSPLPVERIGAFLADCQEVLVPELNYEGQLANLVSGQLGRPLRRLNRVTGAPMQVEEILEQVRALAKPRAAA